MLPEACGADRAASIAEGRGNYARVDLIIKHMWSQQGRDALIERGDIRQSPTKDDDLWIDHVDHCG